ncbi:TPA: glycosyl hydrolase family 8 [Streptococcus suis]|nr:glycosyl hydrolase family 8 [Streptococcus suis]HEM6320474.1 glycosyl hydrolase family 8 [Streptococcus suis]
MNKDNKLKAVVLAGDYGYIRQIETTLKSLIFHNKNIKVYIFNQDIPKEWFTHYKQLLNQLGSDLIDIKLLDVGLSQKWTLHQNLSHINYMTFARYYIPQFVEEDAVLYLDSDIVVTSDLTDLFTINLSDNYLAATRDAFGYGMGFNAGVLLINNKLWKNENIQEQLIELTNKEFQHVREGDQSILNLLLKDQHLPLEDIYNFQIGYDRGAFNYRHHHIFNIPLKPLPAIIHYLSGDKPWNTYSSGRLREVWWHYQMMDWSKIEQKWISEKREVSKPVYKGKLLIITNTHLIEQIEDLIKELPDYAFHIVAFTDMADSLKKLASFDNVFLHPKVIGYILENMIKECDIYLDINHGSKDPYFLNLVMENEKPVLSFDNLTAKELKNYSNHFVSAQDDVKTMIKIIKNL